MFRHFLFYHFKQYFQLNLTAMANEPRRQWRFLDISYSQTLCNIFSSSVSSRDIFLSYSLLLWVVSTPWTYYMLFISFFFQQVSFVDCRLKHMNIYSFSTLFLLQLGVLSWAQSLWVGLLWHRVNYFSENTRTLKRRKNLRISLLG